MLVEMSDIVVTTIEVALELMEKDAANGRSPDEKQYVLDSVRDAYTALRTPMQPARGRYSHRNGETELPTMNDYFWFNGVDFEGLETKGKALIVEDSSGRFVLFDFKNRLSMYRLTELTGQWYGPEVAPWDSQQPVVVNDDGLLPCPFCGDSTRVRLEQPKHWLYRVYCHNCGGSGYETDTQSEAVATWNKRVAPQPTMPEPPLPLEAIGYCWRWAQLFAEKINDEERYKFMCSEIDKVVLWEEETKRRRPQAKE